MPEIPREILEFMKREGFDPEKMNLIVGPPIILGKDDSMPDLEDLISMLADTVTDIIQSKIFEITEDLDNWNPKKTYDYAEFGAGDKAIRARHAESLYDGNILAVDRELSMTIRKGRIDYVQALVQNVAPLLYDQSLQNVRMDYLLNNMGQIAEIFLNSLRPKIHPNGTIYVVGSNGKHTVDIITKMLKNTGYKIVSKRELEPDEIMMSEQAQINLREQARLTGPDREKRIAKIMYTRGPAEYLFHPEYLTPIQIEAKPRR